MQTTNISELSLCELTDRLEAERDSATGQDFKAWAMLTDLATNLSAESDNDILVRGRRWMLKTLSLHGFRGAVEPITVNLDAHPSLTVLHGENGAGKSSLAEAVRVALTGKTGATYLGSTKNDGLWHTDNYRSRGVKNSEVKVHLVDYYEPNCRLTITTQESDNGIERTAELSDNGKLTIFESSSSAWSAWDLALLTNPPVLAYAELFNELRTKKDLHSWLTQCLSMDVATRLFDRAVADAKSQAKFARDQIREARERAQKEVEDADARATENGVSNITDISWTEFFDVHHLEAWIEDNHLEHKVRLHIKLQTDQLEKLEAYASEFKTLLNDFNNSAASELTPAVIAQLIQLDSALSSQPNTKSCPVCGTPGDWRTHLHEQMPGFQATRQATDALRAHCRQRGAELIEPMRKILDVLPATFEVSPSRRYAVELIEEISQLNADDLDSGLLSSLTKLTDWVLSEEGTHLIKEAIASADVRHEWQCARWEAVKPYLEIWSQHHVKASTAETWDTAQRRWNSHLQQLRNDRSQTFSDLVAPKVAALLSDVGLRVDTLDILKNDSRLSIVDNADLAVELNYLSAGQRNALILGPILVAAEGGLFGFSILDDPVHSFDDFRVDQLAATINSMSENQALIIATHDGRFVEYLRVHAHAAFSVYHISRSVTGHITLAEVDSPWDTVLEHANHLLKKVEANAISDTGISDIQCLLRMAADSALEALFLRLNSVKPPEERSEWRQKFDNALTTKKRIGSLSGSLSPNDPNRSRFDSAYNNISRHLDAWNDSTHGAPAVTLSCSLHEQFADAKQFCIEINEIGR